MHQDVSFWVPLFPLKGRGGSQREVANETKTDGHIRTDSWGSVFAQLLTPEMLLPTEPKMTNVVWSLRSTLNPGRICWRGPTLLIVIVITIIIVVIIILNLFWPGHLA